MIEKLNETSFNTSLDSSIKNTRMTDFFHPYVIGMCNVTYRKIL